MTGSVGVVEGLDGENVSIGSSVAAGDTLTRTGVPRSAAGGVELDSLVDAELTEGVVGVVDGGSLGRRLCADANHDESDDDEDGKDGKDLHLFL